MTKGDGLTAMQSMMPEGNRSMRFSSDLAAANGKDVVRSAWFAVVACCCHMIAACVVSMRLVRW